MPHHQTKKGILYRFIQVYLGSTLVWVTYQIGRNLIFHGSLPDLKGLLLEIVFLVGFFVLVIFVIFVKLGWIKGKDN